MESVILKSISQHEGVSGVRADAAEGAPHETVTSIDTARRYDMYLLIHKGLRAFMGATLTALGRMDGDDADEVAHTLDMVRELLAFCRGHLLHENAFVHPAMELRRPGSSRRTAGDHVGHEHAFDDLEQDVRAVERSAGSARVMAATRLYRHLAVFVAENFAHMHVEEMENNAALWEAYTDAELLAIEHALVASLSPEENARSLRWMVPHMTPAERAALFKGMRAAAPAAVFEGALAVVRPHLNDRDWAKLMAAL